MELVRLVYERLWHDDPAFGLDKILAVVGELAELPNRGIGRNTAGTMRSRATRKPNRPRLRCPPC